MKNFSISKLAETIISRRKLLKMTQQDLADKAGMNRSMLCRLENQDYIPSMDQLTRLANTLEFDVSDVFIEYNPPVFHRVVPKNISVFGAGYVGLSIATLLARHHHITLVDIIPEKVAMINQRISPIQDEYILKHFARADLDLTATLDAESACQDAEFVIIAVPTSFDSKKRYFDTTAVESAIATAHRINPNTMMVIKSTVPVGFTNSVRERYGTKNILFSPEFQRKTKALYDNLYPSRIIVGCDDITRDRAKDFAELMRDAAMKKEVEVLLMELAEAEAVSLFSDAFLALRNSFFNELDTYAEFKKLNSRNIIRGVCMDPRIGMHNNNPSFGGDGYYSPKYFMQLLANCETIPLQMMPAIWESTRMREEYVAKRILEQAGIDEDNSLWDEFKEKKVTVGVFHLSMYEYSDDIQHGSMHEVMKHIKAEGANMIIYEPALNDGAFFLGSKVINDLRRFKRQSDIIITNRYDSCLDDVVSKVYTRDLFSRAESLSAYN